MTITGQLVWTEQYQSGDQPADMLSSTIQLDDGSLISCGLADNSNTGGNAGWLVKTDSSGELIWQRVYDKNQFTDLFYSVLATDDGGFLLSGQAINDSTNSQDAWLLKVDSVGCPYPNCTVGINELEPTEVVVDVWPNPATAFINLEVGQSPDSEIELTCTDMRGQIILSQNIVSNRLELDVTNWPNGIYLLTLTGTDFQSSVRVVVQR